MHLSPWRTESETVLGLSWVAVVGVPWGDGWTLLYGTFGGLLTQETKETRFPTPASGIDTATDVRG
jgi:hypothetical protein